MKNVVRMTVVAVAAVGAAAAAQKPASRPPLYKSLLDCRSLSDNSTRLACYDHAAGAMEEAEKKSDLMVIDRKQMQETRRSLFGFALPKFSIFGGGRDDGAAKDDLSEINSTVTTARPIGGGKWSIKLGDESGTWEALDGIRFDPASGDKVRIRKASLGSYLGQVGMNRGVRFRRVQ